MNDNMIVERTPNCMSHPGWVANGRVVDVWPGGVLGVIARSRANSDLQQVFDGFALGLTKAACYGLASFYAIEVLGPMAERCI